MVWCNPWSTTAFVKCAIFGNVLSIYFSVTFADIVFENELIKPEEIFDLHLSLDSAVSTFDDNKQSKYYCVFRSNWNKKNHPEDFPTLARYGAPVIFSHTKQYTPFLKNREAPTGIEKMAETGYTDGLVTELQVAGDVVIGEYNLGKAMVLDQVDWNKNFMYLPAINVTATQHYLSGIAAITPSPDWFTGFYMFDVVKETGQIYWDRFLLRTYPWDAGTDNGKLYVATDEDSDPPQNVERFTVESAPNKIFVNAAGNEIVYVAEWECILHTCPEGEPGCQKENWPPSNGCDVLRYPECDKPCDPATNSTCQKCKNGKYFSECCLAGVDPAEGPTCDGSETSMADMPTLTASYTLTLSLLMMIIVGTFSI